MYLTAATAALRKNPRSHIWDGTDTACRMWSTGGMSKFRKWVVVPKPIGAVCSMCRRVTSQSAKTARVARETRTNQTPQITRHYLNVPFAQKNAAKRLGARWDPTEKRWYAPADSDKSKFDRWIPLQASFSTQPQVFREVDPDQIEHLRSIMTV